MGSAWQKTEQNERITGFFFRAQLLNIVLYFLTLPLKNAVVTHAVILLGAVLTLGCILSEVLTNELNGNRLLIVGAMMLTAVLSILFSGSHISSALLYSLFSFFSLVILLSTSDRYKLTEEMQDFIFRIALILTLLVIAYSFSGIAYMRDNGTISPTLTLYMGNSNFTGTMLLCILCVLLINIPRRRLRLVLIAMSLFLVYLIWRTGSRSCILGIAALAALLIVSRGRQLSKPWIILSALASVAAVPVYLWLYELYRNQGVRFLNKSLFSGRQFNYMEYLGYLDGPVQFLFGNIYRSGLQNAHNGPLAIFSSLGLFGLVLFYILLITVLDKHAQQKTKGSQKIALLSILAICISASAEATMFLGGFPGISFMYCILVMMNCEDATGGEQNA